MEKALKSPRFLAIVRAGKNSLHESFSADLSSRNFDLFVYAYHEDVPKPPRPTDHYLLRPGEKISSYAWLFQERTDLFETYDVIALLDDDLAIDIEALSTCFDIGWAYDLNLWQPSLTLDSYFSYAAFLQNPNFKLRYTNFVEMMCPFMTSETLRRAVPFLAMGYPTGPDLIWSRLHEQNEYKSAIIDAVSVKHTRMVGHTIGIETGGRVRSYDDITNAFMEEVGETFRGNVVYAGVERTGKYVRGRVPIALRTLRMFRGLTTTPHPKRKYIHHLLASLNHILRRPIALDPLPNSSLF
jgi:hypothetical protein